jgi:glycosyltransferase involved in cell wall biosynthesis
MINNKKICVVVPAYNEERQITKVIKNMPDFVDRIVIVDDNSVDGTHKVVQSVILNNDYPKQNSEEPAKITVENSIYGEADRILINLDKKELKSLPEAVIFNESPENDRVILIKLNKNSGNGKAIARGFKWAKENNMDIVAVMDGDGQMDPGELLKIVNPIIKEDADYVKGNRFMHKSSWYLIPKIRFIGNSVLSILTKIASGYWKVSDTQTGYIAMSNKALNMINLHEIYRSFGWPNDLLVKMNMANIRLKEVEIKPVYNIGEKSKMKLYKIIPRISFLLIFSFIKRLWIKYFFKDFHPLFLLYNFSVLLFLLDLKYIYKIIYAFINQVQLNFEPIFAFLFLTISAFQSLLFAMWMDIQDNERLYV